MRRYACSFGIGWIARLPTTDMKIWLKDCPVDLRLYHPIQMHFLPAKVVAEDGFDAFPERSGVFMAGSNDTVRGAF